jgi:acetyltransferase-like isoleucine patch superfamily enzyme
MEPVEPDATLEQLRSIYTRLRSEMQARWKRDLPFEEMLFDRWERARNLGFGEGASIYHSSYVFGDVRVGADTWIGPLTLLDGSGGLTIGRHCSISAGVQIYTHDSWRWAVSGGDQALDHAPVTIADCCYLGGQTVVAKGVQIGEHSVIGACSFVNRDIPAYSVAAGTPCRVLGRVIIENGDVRLEYDRETP